MGDKKRYIVKEVNIMKSPLFEALKEGLRLALFGVLAYIITSLAQYFNAMPQTDTGIVVVTFILRFIDKWMAEKNKAILPMGNARGISLF